MSWTEEEKRGFLEWNRKRKTGELGTPIRFKSTDELRKWLKSQE